MSWDVILKAVNNNPSIPLNELILSESVSIKNRIAIENLQTFGTNSYFYDDVELRRSIYADQFCLKISSICGVLWNQANADGVFGLLLEGILSDLSDAYDFQSVSTFEEYTQQEWFGITLKEITENPLWLSMVTSALKNNFSYIKNANGVQTLTGNTSNTIGAYRYDTGAYNGKGIVLGFSGTGTGINGNIFTVCDGEKEKAGSMTSLGNANVSYNLIAVKPFEELLYGIFEYSTATTYYSVNTIVYYIPF